MLFRSGQQLAADHDWGLGVRARRIGLGPRAQDGGQVVDVQATRGQIGVDAQPLARLDLDLEQLRSGIADYEKQLRV